MGFDGWVSSSVLIHQGNQFARVVGVCCVSFFDQPLSGFFAVDCIVATFVLFVIFVPVVYKVDDAGEKIGEVNEAVGNSDPLVIDELLSFGVGAGAFEAEEVVTAGYDFAVAGFQ